MTSRIISIFSIICVCMLILILQIVNINQRYIEQVGFDQGKKTLIIDESRGKIYDRNLELLTNTNKQLIAAVSIGNGSANINSLDYTPEQLKEKLSLGYPFLTFVENEINLESVRTFEVSSRYTDDNLAPHLIGYLNNEQTLGLMGIEKVYNTFLNDNSGKLSISYEVDAMGKVIQGLDKFVNDDNYTSKAGVVLTIDSEIQQIVESELAKSTIESGAVIVMKVDSGEILAMASYPKFNPNDVASSLTQENSPMVNKVLQSYSVGSVFKPIIAAAALENGISENTIFECKGSITLGDTTYKCYNTTVHGKLNMTQALEVSCNCYFINLMQKLDVDYLLKLCQDIGFSKKDELAQGYFSSSGKLPTREQLESVGNLANFAFGQGDLLATPIQMLKAYHVLATGNLIQPTVVRGVANEVGLMDTPTSAVPQKLITDLTVKKIREMLQSVVDSGNANKAKSELLNLSGKTGTAQSGIYIDNKEVCRTWFTGFFPSNNPNYVVVILNENGTAGSVDCAPVYKNICEKIALAQ